MEPTEPSLAGRKPDFSEALRLWFKIGCIGFGGPSAQIAILHTEVVERREWVSDREFVRALQFCMLLPGPEAQQLATYLGWRLHGLRGGIVAGALFVLPSALLLWLLSFLYVIGQQWPLLHAFFDGLKPAVVAIVASALWRIGRRTVITLRFGIMALVAFLFFALHVSYPVVVIGFGLLGFLLSREASAPDPEIAGDFVAGDWRESLRMAFAVLAIWAVPVLGLFLWLGSKALPVKIALFYGKVAIFSFGGAYAALSYVSLHAVGDWSWVTSGQMMDGLGLAETTPGPLLIALQFVAFLAAYHAPGMLSPLLSATLGSIAGVWSLFLPSFLWIFTLAPHMERLSRHRRMAGALAAIGAVVTAVIAYLALWFAGSVFLVHGMNPNHNIKIAWHPLIVALLAFSLLQSGRLGIVPLILLTGGIGVGFRIFTLG